MDVLIHSDGQLYPPRRQDGPKPPPKPKPAPPPPPPPQKPAQELPWEDLLLAGVAFLILRSSDKPDIPLLLALAYILFDQKFELKKFI